MLVGGVPVWEAECSCVLFVISAGLGEGGLRRERSCVRAGRSCEVRAACLSLRGRAPVGRATCPVTVTTVTVTVTVIENLPAIPIQAVLAMKRLGPSTCLPLIVPAPADPAPCPVFAALSYL